MVLLIDNYDSFTYNLADYLLQMKTGLKIFRNDDSFGKIIRGDYTGVIFSPGPGRPENAGILNQLIAHYENKLPVLGICLGHQAIGVQSGAKLVKALKPMHGKRSLIRIKEDYIFNTLPGEFHVVRYHSLILQDLKGGLEPLAFSSEGEIMAIRHRTKNIRGVQFHPEAILTEYGFKILQNWISYNQIS
ncbi:MAG: aminodeoxychorismate/anthranilate synthase component II [Cyclobacteriaceae bacterium]|nr:aminodeoxychorismate/anthranilate synthase component II [Cyclobacteriaceae bacterium]